MSRSELDSNRNLAIDFLNLVASGNVDEGFAKFVAADFIHHNQYCKGDRASLIAAMKENSQQMPNRKFSIKMVLQEGDKVMAHSLVIKDAMEISVVHIMNIRNNLITEMWDLGQVINKESPNENGPF
jgi:predicted SnoaL-like aldol condensation-catalyzing enzyme